MSSAVLLISWLVIHRRGKAVDMTVLGRGSGRSTVHSQQPTAKDELQTDSRLEEAKSGLHPRHGAAALCERGFWDECSCAEATKGQKSGSRRERRFIAGFFFGFGIEAVRIKL